MTRIGFAKRFELFETGGIIEIPYFFPYMNYIRRIEGNDPQIYFVVYTREDGAWAIRGVETGRGFELRKKLPHAGVGGAELSEISGVPGAIFSHKNGFLTVFDTKDHALAFVRYTLSSPTKSI
jgi:uncharacterized UPF0160 family protein